MKKLFLINVLLLGLCAFSVAQVSVTFKLNQLSASTPNPKSVFLAGSFNGWNPANADWQLKPVDDGGYALSQKLAPGSYEFKVTRGGWDKVECLLNGATIENRTLHVQHDTTVVLSVANWADLHPQLQKQHTASPQVHLLSEHFEIPQLHRQRRVWIYLPKGYETSRKRYPVIYMTDGQNLFDEYTSGYGEWGIDEFMDTLKAKYPQSIIVGVDHGDSLRIGEYSPYDSKYGKGEGDQYADFTAKTLKPYIDSHYRTLNDAAHSAVAGSSMGGLISMYIALKYPAVFGLAGIFSPAFWINPAIYNYANERALKTSRFYFVCGDIESEKEVADMKKMVDKLRKKGFTNHQTMSTVMPGFKHNEKQWRVDFPGFYGWLSPPTL